MKYTELVIENPKRKKQLRSAWDNFFPYYAGYPDVFAQKILASARLKPTSVVLDPWNGSGTTTYVASQMGIPAIGLDLNPVMVIVSRARMLASSEADSLLPLANEVLRQANRNKITCSDSDPLLLWFESPTANWLRSIEFSIRSTLLGEMSLAVQGTNFDRISSIAATFYVVLFNLAKEQASAFQSSNPTWLRKPKKGEARIAVERTHISAAFLLLIRVISNALGLKSDLSKADPSAATTRHFDSTHPFGLDRSVDLVLTSPPYCTRIDYTAATRVELAIIHPILAFEIDDLSRSMIGSTKVPQNRIDINPEWGIKCVEFLDKVRLHSSYASQTYYLKTHTDYFEKIDKSLSNIAGALSIGGTAILVVQDSHYKEIHNDVPSIVTEIAARHGLLLKRREDFEVKTSMSGINPRARAHKHSRTNEAVLCFQNEV